MHAWGHFIGQQVIAHDEQLDSQQADVVESFEDGFGKLLGPLLKLCPVDALARRAAADAKNPALVNVFRERIERHLSGGASCRQDRHFRLKAYKALEDQRYGLLARCLCALATLQPLLRSLQGVLVLLPL